jgi:hypothetical protein
LIATSRARIPASSTSGPRPLPLNVRQRASQPCDAAAKLRTGSDQACGSRQGKVCAPGSSTYRAWTGETSTAIPVCRRLRRRPRGTGTPRRLRQRGAGWSRSAPGPVRLRSMGIPAANGRQSGVGLGRRPSNSGPKVERCICTGGGYVVGLVGGQRRLVSVKKRRGSGPAPSRSGSDPPALPRPIHRCGGLS